MFEIGIYHTYLYSDSAKSFWTLSMHTMLNSYMFDIPYSVIGPVPQQLDSFMTIWESSTRELIKAMVQSV